MAAKKKAKLSPEQQAAQKAELLEMNRLASRSLEQTLTETIAKLGEAWNKEQRERAMRVARDLADLYVKQAYGATGVEREIAHAKAAAQNIIVGESITALDAIQEAIFEWLDRVSLSFLDRLLPRAAPEE